MGTSKTRAEIQAEIETVVSEAFAAGRACAVFEANPCPITREYSVEAAYVLEKQKSELESLIAADLIPREEHERAVEEARVKDVFDAARAFIRLLPEGTENGVVTCDGHTYRVTVERVDATDTLPEQPADAKPVGWCVDFGDGGLSGSRFNTKASAELHSSDFPVIPLYRHPAPAKLDANTALKYLVKEYDLDTGHMDSARPRTYPFDHNGHVYEVVVRRKGEVVEKAGNHD